MIASCAGGGYFIFKAGDGGNGGKGGYAVSGVLNINKSSDNIYYSEYGNPNGKYIIEAGGGGDGGSPAIGLAVRDGSKGSSGSYGNVSSNYNQIALTN